MKENIRGVLLLLGFALTFLTGRKFLEAMWYAGTRHTEWATVAMQITLQLGALALVTWFLFWISRPRHRGERSAP